MQPLRIGIDVSPTNPTKGRGGRRNLTFLLHALGENPGPHQYVVFYPNEEILPYLQAPCFKHEHPRWRFPLFRQRGTGWFGKFFVRDLDLVHFPFADIWYSRRGKAVVTIYDLAPLHFPDRFFANKKQEEAYSFHLSMIRTFADRIVTGSNHSREDLLLHLKLPPERIRTVYAANDPVFIGDVKPLSEAEMKSLGIQTPYYLFVGAMDFRKNTPLLLKAFSIYRKRGGLAHLVLVGEQDPSRPYYYPPIQPVLEAMKEKDHVSWLRGITDEVLSRIYTSARGLVFPSILEGFGSPLAEAMACGTPIIATRLSCLPEIAGRAAFFVDLHEEEIAEAMSRFDQDEALRQRLVDSGRERAKLFLPKRAAEEMVKVYEEVANSKG